MNRPHVMIVDDDPKLCKYLCTVLELDGMCTSFHTDATSAIEELSDKDLDLDVLVLDVHLPDVSGFGVLHILSQKDVRIPTLLISGMDMSSASELQEQFGFSDHLEKPFGMPLFLRRVQALLQVSGDPSSAVTQVI